jgi:hypothetical protein
VAQHGAERDDSRPTCDQQQRPARRLVPDEVPTDRPAKLQLVTRFDLVDEVRGDLPVLETLDGQDQVVVFGAGRNGVAALGLIPVLGREANVDVLAGTVPRPGRRVEHEALGSGRFIDQLDDRRELPGQSP